MTVRYVQVCSRICVVSFWWEGRGWGRREFCETSQKSTASDTHLTWTVTTHANKMRFPNYNQSIEHQFKILRQNSGYFGCRIPKQWPALTLKQLFKWTFLTLTEATFNFIIDQIWPDCQFQDMVRLPRIYPIISKLLLTVRFTSIYVKGTKTQLVVTIIGG